MTTRLRTTRRLHQLMILIATSFALVISSPPTNAADDFTATTSRGSPFIWQPLPLRATFRPLNRGESSSSFRPPRPPRPPATESTGISERSISSDSSGENAFNGNRFSGASDSTFFQPPPPFEVSTTTTTTSAPTTTTARPESSEDDDERPTRQPMNRFRPTRAPSDDEDTSASGSALATGGATGGDSTNSSSRLSSECFECICEASTNCNAQSRCQTSDVRHTRCGMFLISYDQWLSTGLSRSLVSREALARDAAADERAFYECVTQRDCAERLLAIYLARNSKDCDKDGRVDCYDMAAIHHSGLEQCASESLLDSQYWSDFNACLGFGR